MTEPCGDGETKATKGSPISATKIGLFSRLCPHSRKTPLAWLNLVHSKVRTAAGIAGVTFAVVLIFLQLGFLGTAEATAHLVYNTLRFDLLLRSVEYRAISNPRSFPRARLYQAGSVVGVAQVIPFHTSGNMWRNPASGLKRRILTMAVPPSAAAFVAEDIQRQLLRLSVAEDVLIDEKSNRDFGPVDGRRFGQQDIGRTAEMAGHRVRIAGIFRLGSSFEADGTVVLGEQGFLRITPGRKPGDVSLGLVQLSPGAEPQAVQAALRRVLPADVEVLRRDEALAIERKMWIEEMSIGVIFQLGWIVAVAVGVAIVYQILASDVTDHLPEYATLKAVGYSGMALGGVVLQQALLLALLGFVPGLAIANALYRLTEYKTGLPMGMQWSRIVWVLGFTVAMCTLSGLGAVRKVRRADPADIF